MVTLRTLLASMQVAEDALAALQCYAGRSAGRAGCLAVLRQALSGRGEGGLGLTPEAYSKVQGVLAEVMVGAMQDEDSAQLGTLVAISQAISLRSAEETRLRRSLRPIRR